MTATGPQVSRNLWACYNSGLFGLTSQSEAPAAIGPYSQGYAIAGLVITSGQLPVNMTTGTIPEGIAAQAEESCKNVGAILAAAGSGCDTVVKTTCFLADMAAFNLHRLRKGAILNYNFKIYTVL